MVASGGEVHPVVRGCCSRCGGQGHLAASCTVVSFYRIPPAGNHGPVVGTRGAGFRRNARLSKEGGTEHRKFSECFACGEVGHDRSSCTRRSELREIVSAPLTEKEKGVLDRSREIYGGITGYNIPEEESQAVRAQGGSPTYGELEPVATLLLLRTLELTPEDILYDLGCGTGKVLIIAALASAVGRLVGLELSETRVVGAREAIRRADLSPRCSVFSEDFVVSPRLPDATVVYCCNVTLPNSTFAALVERLVDMPNLRLVATMKHPFQETTTEAAKAFGAAFKAVGAVNLRTSWSPSCRVLLYKRR
eukprot:TRINITY_DN28992_c0_g1_i1.p1 TRINITY_DN28992_c0_g1~~TRINITY_DN28992_c0_g1_i1.p1  ORF type:complete len:307 (+),score=41.40 TRINITY_DN28992_c0_g1_i1:171-1091(+)